MSLPLAFHPATHAEINDAYEWYEKQRKGLGEKFLAALEVALSGLRQYPQVHQIIYKTVRRTLVRRFPYSVLYRILDDRVEVVSIHHSKRSPARWKSRI